MSLYINMSEKLHPVITFSLQYLVFTFTYMTPQIFWYESQKWKHQPISDIWLWKTSSVGQNSVLSSDVIQVWLKSHSVIFTEGRIGRRTFQCLGSVWHESDRKPGVSLSSLSTAERLNKSVHPCLLSISFFPLRVYTSIRPSTCLSLNVCRRVRCVCLSLSAFVCCVSCLWTVPPPPCIRTSRAESFSPRGLLGDRFNCAGVFTKPHRNWQTRQNCSHCTSRSQTLCAQRLPACLE